MKRRNILAILTALLLIVSVNIVSAASRASEVIFRVSAGLNSNKTATFVIVTKVPCEELGTMSYSLYKSNGVLVKSETIDDYGSGARHSTSVNLADYIQNGNSYYVTADFIADGETRSLSSGTLYY